ncbi:MAG: DUF2752 domain-containing protein [Flavobacteriaceae bacterium]|nr:DUF2752 domain-containing protein [Flavobacteriaceae bacterium]
MLIFFGILAFFYFIVNPSEVNFMPRCPLYSTTGIYCPGCGSQRALHDFLHLDLMGVIRHNVLFLLGIFVLLYHLSVESIEIFTKKKVKNVLYYPKTPLIFLGIILIYWVLRNLPYYPFNLLAPAK